MATTFSWELGKKRQDGSCAIYIRITHNRVLKREKMPFVATASDFNRKGVLTNNLLIGEVEKRINEFRERLIKIGYDADMMHVNTLYNRLSAPVLSKAELIDGFRLDFMKYGYEHVERLRGMGKNSTANGYAAALNSFHKFLKRDSVDINEIDKRMLMRYKDWFFVPGEEKKRAFELYMGCLQTLYNKAKAEFNDEDSGLECIPKSPFRTIKYKMTRAEKSMIEKKAVSADVIRMIANLPDLSYDVTKCNWLAGRESPLCNFARDMFLLSFCLCGMNAIDMYNLKELKNGKVCYYRSKTHERSGMDSLYRIDYSRPNKGHF